MLAGPLDPGTRGDSVTAPEPSDRRTETGGRAARRAEGVWPASRGAGLQPSHAKDAGLQRRLDPESLARVTGQRQNQVRLPGGGRAGQTRGVLVGLGSPAQGRLQGCWPSDPSAQQRGVTGLGFCKRAGLTNRLCG